MRYIPKGHEPALLREKRETPGATYAAFDELRNALAEEQGFICAFCTRKLDLTARDERGEPLTKIAHLLSRHPPRASPRLAEERRILGMTYRNMVLACDGFTVTGMVKHCDEQQGNADITIPLFDRTVMERVTFSSAGQVRHPTYQDQIGYDDQDKGLLNLNATALVERRRTRWLTVATTLQKQGLWKEGELTKQVQVWTNKDTKGHLREDCQCVAFFLQEKLRLLEAQTKKPFKKTK